MTYKTPRPIKQTTNKTRVLCIIPTTKTNINQHLSASINIDIQSFYTSPVLSFLPAFSRIQHVLAKTSFFEAQGSPVLHVLDLTHTKTPSNTIWSKSIKPRQLFQLSSPFLDLNFTNPTRQPPDLFSLPRSNLHSPLSEYFHVAHH